MQPELMCLIYMYLADLHCLLPSRLAPGFEAACYTNLAPVAVAHSPGLDSFGSWLSNPGSCCCCMGPAAS